MNNSTSYGTAINLTGELMKREMSDKQ